jgi:aspartate carbamoyltransferase catalytic subunit
MPRALISVDDLDEAEISTILTRATELERARAVMDKAGRVVGLLFFEASLRTRAGFAVAAARLGWTAVEVAAQRESPTSVAESVPDTLRTLSGMVDAIVARPGMPVDRRLVNDHVVCAYVNAGDTGPAAEHPTQALIDLYALERWRGPLSEIHLGICGDPRMRAVRSLLRILSRRPPRRISLYADDRHWSESSIPSSLAGIVDRRVLPQVDDLDVLYVAGIPHGALPLDARQRLIVTSAVMARLGPDAIVLSPLPLIDEVDPEVRADTRTWMFRQSDQGLLVRMAVLEWIGAQD